VQPSIESGPTDTEVFRGCFAVSANGAYRVQDSLPFQPGIGAKNDRLLSGFDEFRWEVRGADEIRFRPEHGEFDGIFQLADVAGPTVLLDQTSGWFLHPVDRFSEPLSIFI
jgi:hypothetical protein